MTTDRQRFTATAWRQRRDREHAANRAARGGRPNPKRITRALDVNALEGPEVDVACGGVEPMVDEWEAGTRVPTDEQLVLLSTLTGFAVDWFYRDDPEPLGTTFVCVRSGPGKGCHVTDHRPDADVVQLRPDTLW